MRVDLDKRLVFPCKIVSGLRLDMILYSNANRLLIIIELTVPWQSRNNRHMRKRNCSTVIYVIITGNMVRMCSATLWKEDVVGS